MLCKNARTEHELRRHYFTFRLIFFYVNETIKSFNDFSYVVPYIPKFLNQCKIKSKKRYMIKIERRKTKRRVARKRRKKYEIYNQNKIMKREW